MTYIPSAICGASHDDAVEPTTTTLNPNSQGSSFAEASVSQHSHLGGVSVAYSQPVQNDPGRDVATPSTSLSNYSSQENVQHDRTNIDRSHSIHDKRTMAKLVATDFLDEKTEHRIREHSAGLKRTATGQIRSPTVESSSTSPVGANAYSHSRKASTTSRSSHIGEISNKLQARLSYAKVKVQNGWENHSISELERMTSNQNSPVAASSRSARGNDTPPARYSPVDHISARSLRPASSNMPPEYDCLSPPTQGLARSSGHLIGRLTASRTTPTPIARPDETYEQFWQSHSNHTVPQTRALNFPSIHVPALAPPVELSSRTSATTKQRSPPLPTSQQFPGRLPSTPPSRGNPLSKMRTPSQQAAVEQDALEGLLSMNSPANSQSHPSTTRAPFHNSLNGQAIGPTAALNGIINGPPMPFVGPMIDTRAQRELNDDEINDMLDDMPESSSSDDDDPIERRIAPGFVAS